MSIETFRALDWQCRRLRRRRCWSVQTRSNMIYWNHGWANRRSDAECSRVPAERRHILSHLVYRWNHRRFGVTNGQDPNREKNSSEWSSAITDRGFPSPTVSVALLDKWFPCRSYASSSNHSDTLKECPSALSTRSISAKPNLLLPGLFWLGECGGDDERVELAAGGGESEERRRIRTALVWATHCRGSIGRIGSCRALLFIRAGCGSGKYPWLSLSSMIPWWSFHRFAITSFIDLKIPACVSLPKEIVCSVLLSIFHSLT